MVVPARKATDNKNLADGTVLLAFRLAADSPDKFNVDCKRHPGGARTITFSSLPSTEKLFLISFTLHLNRQDQLTRVDFAIPMPVKHGSARQSEIRNLTCEFNASEPLPSPASLQIRVPSRFEALRTSIGKRPRTSPQSPTGHIDQRLRTGNGSPPASPGPSHSQAPAHFVTISPAWPAHVQEGARTLTFFEPQEAMRCLQHAYNNLAQRPCFSIPDHQANHGADMDLVCRHIPGGLPLLKPVTFDHGQFDALADVLAEHADNMIIFAGDLDTADGDGHYKTLMRRKGACFELDSLNEGPVWIQDTRQYFRDLLEYPGRLVGAMVPGSAPQIEGYLDFLSNHVRQDIARGLGDIYGTQPIVELSSHFGKPDATGITAQRLAAYFQAHGIPAASVDQPVAADQMSQIDGWLNSIADGHTNLLLMPGTYPFLLPAFYRPEQGVWMARVPAADGWTMHTQPLQAVLDEQQRRFDETERNTTNPARRQEIARDRQKLAAIRLRDWPEHWPPAQAPVSALSPQAIAHAGTDEAESDHEAIFRKPAANADLPWEIGKTYSVTGVAPRTFTKFVSTNRWRTQEFVHHGYKVTMVDIRALSQACDAVPGEHLGEGVFVHRDVVLKSGKLAKVYRKLNKDGELLDIGIPIVGKVQLENFTSISEQMPAKQAKRIKPVARTIEFNTEYNVRQRMFMEGKGDRGDRVRTLYPLLGMKRDALEEDPAGIVLRALYKGLNAPKINGFVDAFAGTGYLTIWVAAQQRSRQMKTDLRLVMNEWDQYRHNTLKTVQRYPEQVKQALNAHLRQIEKLFYRVINAYPVFKNVDGKASRETDFELAHRIASRAGSSVASMSSAEMLRFLDDTVKTWLKTAEVDHSMNLKLNTELKTYILDNFTFPLPPEPKHWTKEDIELRASNAALYLLAQHNGRIPSTPVNLSRSEHKGPHMRADGMILGRHRGIENRLLEKVAVIVNTKKRRSEKDSKTTRLRTELSTAPKQGWNETFFHSLPSHIDYVCDALTGVTIQQGDGWELLESLQQGTLGVIDPTYWEPDAKGQKFRYGKDSLEETTKAGFLRKLDKYVMPAWGGRNVHLMLFNRYDSEIAGAMEHRGFSVFPLTNLRSSYSGQTGLKEMMAINFTVNDDATLRPFITHPTPAAPLGMPGEEPPEDEADASEASGVA
ncbi:hypothetical protein RY831_01030 [Noviherbaspirillum sp. CPCC 100848]|uniref:Uncharacterized protein n=1 Tax=Noviherbaspirillum album TaxID=3080276 RepID=A0ABU6J289_9BURK|nr:hypothetical protein [Noviherbaspirillum sp. CPCC 100848]MEC4717722.1 hypothetical protein [Noviherbaspirillum sp. CPCC 100848]